MTADSVLTVVVALCCVLAIGATSTTLDSTVTTNPEEVTDFDYSKVPIGTGQAQKLDDAIDSGRSATGQDGGANDAQSESGSSGDEKQQAAKADRDADESGDHTRSASSSGEGNPEQSAGSGGNERQQQSGGSGNEMNQGGTGENSQSGEGDGTGIRDQTLLERLLSLLQDLFDLLLSLLPYLVLTALVGAAVRYRERILAWLTPGAPQDESENRDGEGGADDATVREPDPQNEISAAWLEMVERLDLADRRELTPRECAAAAERRGVDDETVRRLTALFEEVRYGGVRVTDERRERAEQTLDRVRSQLEVQQ